MPRSALAGLTAPDDQVADVEMPVGRLTRPFGDPVDVEVERPRCGRVQRQLELGLLARLAQSGCFDRLVVVLDVAARLQEPSELLVV